MDKNILSVLVVDDELPIREAMNLINWEQFGTLLAGTAANGRDALDFCRNFVPDIVISDITMPVMDGLEFFRRLTEEFPSVKGIILSVHNDFEYARKALQMGAIDYILKTSIDDETLERAINKAREMIEQGRLVQKSTKEKQRDMLSMTYAGLNPEVEDYKIFINKLVTCGIKVTFPLKHVCLFIETIFGHLIFVNAEIRDLLDTEEAIENWVTLKNNIFLLFINTEMKASSRLERYLKDLAQRLSEEIHKRLLFVTEDLRIFFAISDEISMPKDYISSLEEMKLWRQMAFYYPEKNIFTGKPYIFKALSTETKKNFLLQINQISQNEQLKDFVNRRIRPWALEHLVAPEELKDLMVSLLNMVSQKHSTETSFVQKIWTPTNIDLMLQNLLHEITLKNSLEHNYRDEIVRTIAIIKEKYSEPISLSKVADEVHLSASYLSRLFGSEVGETFNDFLIRIRMEAAENLLRNTNYKVFKIAEMVGIPNYRYFVSVFKNLTGKSPTEFRTGGHNE